MTRPEPVPVTLSGVYFDGHSSRDRTAELTLGHPVLLTLDGATHTFGPHELTLDPPIPGVRRVIRLPGGARFETSDFAPLLSWERAGGRNRALRGVAWLEGRWGSALGRWR